MDTDPTALLAAADAGAVMDPAMEPVVALAEPEPDPQAVADVEESEAQQVREMLQWVRVPSWLQDAFTKAKDERKYLHTEAFAEDDPDRVACNDLLRAIWAKLALIWPQKPEATCKPPPQIEPPPQMHQMAQMEQMQNQMLAQEAAALGAQIQPPPSPVTTMLNQWKQNSERRERSAVTMAGVLNRFATMAELERTAQRAALDAISVGLVWIKVGWSEDPTRDFLGRRRTRDDAQDQLAKLRQLEEDFLAGRFDAQDRRANEMAELREYAQRYASQMVSRDQRWQAIATMQPGAAIAPSLLPEAERLANGTVDIVDLENIRLDWQRVVSPETMHLGRRMAERVWMSRDEVARVFKLADDEKDKLGRSKGAADQRRIGMRENGSEVPDPSEDDLEQEERGGLDGDIAVWELWDREQNRVYWFTPGLDRFLRTEIPEVTRRQWFPYIAVFFNPVSGRFMPVSDVTLGRKLQDELNQGLTDDREARIARYPFYGVGANLISKDDIRAIEQRRPNKVVELTRPAQEVKDQIVKIPGDDYNPDLYQVGIAQARANLERQLGVPSEALQGQSRAKFATQVQVSSDNMLAQSGRNGSALSEVLRQVFEAWADFAAAALPAAQVKAWLGPFAEWPEFNRDQLLAGLHVGIVSAGNRGQRKQDIEDIGQAVVAITGLADAAQRLAMAGWELDLPPLFQRIESAMDLRLPGGLVKRLPMPMGMPGMGQPPAGPQPAPGGKPQDEQRREQRQGLPTQPAGVGVGMNPAA